MFVKNIDVASSLSMTVMTLLFFVLTNKITVKAKAVIQQDFQKH